MATKAKSMFRTQYDGVRLRIRSCPGTMWCDDRSAKIVDNHLCLTPSGKRNTYEEVQSHRYEGDLKAMIKRFQRGDQSVISQVQGFYGDFDGMPTTYAQMVKLTEESRLSFGKLPLAIREAYHHNYREYIADFGSEHFQAVFGSAFKPTTVDTPVKEVSENA